MINDLPLPCVVVFFFLFLLYMSANYLPPCSLTLFFIGSASAFWRWGKGGRGRGKGVKKITHTGILDESLGLYLPTSSLCVFLFFGGGRKDIERKGSWE